MSKTILTTLLFLMLFSCNQQKIAYVENGVVYEKFNATIDMKNKNVKVLTAKQKELAAFEKRLLQLQKTIEGKNAAKNTLLQTYVGERNRYDSLNTAFKHLEEEMEYNTMQKSWEQINAYVKDFGQQNNYDIIHGASGGGNLMYAKKEMDITQEFIDYINTRYDGE